MKRVAVEKSKLTAEEIADMAKGDTVILTRNGQPLASVNDVSGADWESVALANNPTFMALIEESRRSYREEGGISIDELRKELGLKTKPTRKRGKKKP